MLGVCRERRKGSEIIGFAGLAAAALSCSLLFRGTSGNPADTLDASEMTVSQQPTGPNRRRASGRDCLPWRLLAAAALSLGGCGDMFTQVYQRGYIPPEGALEQVPLGATQEQVLIVLGTPSTVATVSGEVVLLHLAARRAEARVPRRRTSPTSG